MGQSAINVDLEKCDFEFFIQAICGAILSVHSRCWLPCLSLLSSECRVSFDLFGNKSHSFTSPFTPWTDTMIVKSFTPAKFKNTKMEDFTFLVTTCKVFRLFSHLFPKLPSSKVLHRSYFLIFLRQS